MRAVGASVYGCAGRKRSELGSYPVEVSDNDFIGETLVLERPWFPTVGSDGAAVRVRFVLGLAATDLYAIEIDCGPGGGTHFQSASSPLGYSQIAALSCPS